MWVGWPIINNNSTRDSTTDRGSVNDSRSTKTHQVTSKQVAHRRRSAITFSCETVVYTGLTIVYASAIANETKRKPETRRPRLQIHWRAGCARWNKARVFYILSRCVINSEIEKRALERIAAGPVWLGRNGETRRRRKGHAECQIGQSSNSKVNKEQPVSVECAQTGTIPIRSRVISCANSFKTVVARLFDAVVSRIGCGRIAYII